MLQRALSDFFVEYELRAHLEMAADPARVRSELHMQIQDAFNEFGVQIMAPAFESQPERPVVVPKLAMVRRARGPAQGRPRGKGSALARPAGRRHPGDRTVSGSPR